MAKLKETREKHGLDVRNDKCTALYPTPERTDNIREEMTQFVKWTPLILGTASDGEYRTENTTAALKNHEPTSGRLQIARILADKIRRMCEADLECRRLAPAWKLDTIVLNNALSFDCCVVPPKALASYAQELDEIVDALLPMFVGQDRREHASIERMGLPKNDTDAPPLTDGIPVCPSCGLHFFFSCPQVGEGRSQHRAPSSGSFDGATPSRSATSNENCCWFSIHFRMDLPRNLWGSSFIEDAKLV